MAGLFFEDFEVGRVYPHEVTRSMTLADSMQVTSLCMETEPTYLDEAWSAVHARCGRIEINPMYALSFVMGVQVTELTLGTTLGNLGMVEMRFPRPVFPGDTLRGQTTILAKRESRSRADRGVVEFLQEGFNQHGELVASCHRKAMMLRRPARENA